MKDSFTRLNFNNYFTCCSITFGHIIQLQRRSIPSPSYVNTVPCHISNARPGEGDGLHFIHEPERVVKHFVLYLKFDKNIFHWTSVIFSQSTEKRLKGNCHEQLTWKRQPELFKFDSRRHRCKAKPPAYDGPLAAKEITPDKRADTVNEKWPENLACCHRRIYLNACAAHDSFPLTSFSYSDDVLTG